MNEKCFGYFTIISEECLSCRRVNECDREFMKRHNYTQRYLERVLEYDKFDLLKRIVNKRE